MLQVDLGRACQYSPFPVIVHPVDPVPLRVQLGQGVPDLDHLGTGGLLDGVGLPLVDHRHLVPQPLQAVLDVLKEHREGHKMADMSVCQWLHPTPPTHHTCGRTQLLTDGNHKKR